MKANQNSENQKLKLMTWEIQDTSTQRTYSIEYAKSNHFIERSSQRNLSENMIQTVIDYGVEYLRQGLVFYVLGQKNLPNKLSAQERRRYRNLVVVSSKDALIITAYRSKHPFRHVKKKSKILSNATA